MKPGPESTATQRAPEKEEFVTRKLIRPVLPVAEQKADASANGVTSNGERTLRTERAPRAERKPFVQEQTFAENFYFQKQLQNKTLMTVVLKNGDTINGTIEWYDRNCLKFNRIGKPNVLLYKPSIRYMYKSSEDSRSR
jgi:sRNA-binding regulator protein Hfq